MQTHIAYGIINKKQSKNEQILHYLHHVKIYVLFIFFSKLFCKMQIFVYLCKQLWKI